MTATLNDLAVTNIWQDIVSTEPSVANTDTLVQVVSSDIIQIVFGGGGSPTGKTGVLLRKEDSIKGNAPSIWVRSFGTTATISITLA